MIVTHNDLDGIVSAFFACYLYGIDYSHVFTVGYSQDRGRQIEEWFDAFSAEYPDEPTIFTDLSWNKGELDWLRVNQKDERGISEIIWIDHHESSKYFEKPEEIFDIVHIETEDVCAADLVYESLSFEKPEVAKKYQEWADIAHDRDLWLNYDREIGMKLDMIVKSAIYRKEVNFLLQDMEKGIDYVLANYKKIWEDGMIRYEKSKQLALNTMEGFTIISKNFIPVHITYVADSHSDVCDSLYKTGDEIIAVINRFPPVMVVNLRTRRDDIDLSKIAEEEFNGGGHKKAAGGKLTKEILVNGYRGILERIQHGIQKQFPVDDNIPF